MIPTVTEWQQIIIEKAVMELDKVVMELNKGSASDEAETCTSEEP